MPAGADTRHAFGGLFTLYVWVTAAAVALVFLVTIFALIRYRRRRDEYPRSRTEAKIVEGLYAIGLLAIAVVLVSATFRTEDRVDAARAEAVKIRISAFQWQWRFEYASGKSVIGTDDAPATLVVPVDVPIEFTETSRDVIHSFWIPAERFKRDAFPGRTTRFDLTFDREGTLLGRCAEFCGLRHTNMDFDVEVVSRDEFDRWLAER